MNSAILTTQSRDAKSVADSLKVDNKAHGMEIKTHTKGKKIITEVRAEKAKTLLAVLDDLIHCQMVAERCIKNGD